MKYTKSIFILMSINIVIAFFLVFIGHQSRDLEIQNKKLLYNIDKTKQKININQIELALHNDNEYLKKLYSIYQNDLEIKKSSKIFKLSELNKINNKEFFRVQYK